MAVHSLCSLSSLIYESQLFIQFSTACLYVIPRKTTVNLFYFQEVVYLQRRSSGTGDNKCMCVCFMCVCRVCVLSLRNSHFLIFILFKDMTERTSMS